MDFGDYILSMSITENDFHGIINRWWINRNLKKKA